MASALQTFAPHAGQDKLCKALLGRERLSEAIQGGGKLISPPHTHTHILSFPSQNLGCRKEKGLKGQDVRYEETVSDSPFTGWPKYFICIFK
jgi:hypothetical protein